MQDRVMLLADSSEDEFWIELQCPGDSPWLLKGGRGRKRASDFLLHRCSPPPRAPEQWSVPPRRIGMLCSTCTAQWCLFWHSSEIPHSHPAPHSDPQRVLLQLELIPVDDYFPVILVYCSGPGWQ